MSGITICDLRGGWGVAIFAVFNEEQTKTRNKMNIEASTEFSEKIYSHLAELFNNPEGENYINLTQVSVEGNATELLHALANLVPAIFYTQLSGETCDLIGFNHHMNRLIYQSKPNS